MLAQLLGHAPRAQATLPRSQLRPCRAAFTTRRPVRTARPDRRLLRRVAAQASTTSPAAQSVEEGLRLFNQGKYEEALPLFLKAQKQQPNADEARAALYNAACAQTKLRQWQQASGGVAGG